MRYIVWVLLSTIMLILGIETSGFGAPNPTNGKTEISYAIPNEVVAYLELHDLSGNKVYRSEALTGSNKLSLDLTGNMPGVYVYTLYANGFEPVIKSLILTR